MPACLPLPAKAVPVSSLVLFPAVSQKIGKGRLGQTAVCSHPGMETREGELAERGSDGRSAGTAPPAAVPNRRCRWPGAPRRGPRRVLAPGSSQDEESVPRQRRETTLFPGEDDSALPEALSYFMPGTYRSSPIPFALSALTPQTSRGAPHPVPVRAVTPRPAAEERGPHAGSREASAPFTEG